MNKDEYGAKVRATLAGQETIPPPSGYQLFTPIIDTFRKEHLFADIFARDVLDFQSRELVTIFALASMTGTAGQFLFHLGAAMNIGSHKLCYTLCSKKCYNSAMTTVRNASFSDWGRRRRKALESNPGGIGTARLLLSKQRCCSIIFHLIGDDRDSYAFM